MANHLRANQSARAKSTIHLSLFHVTVSLCEGTHIQKGWGWSSYSVLGVKKAVLVPLRVFSLTTSAAGAFAVPFRVLNQKSRLCVALELVSLRSEKKFQSMPTEQDLGTS